MNTDTIEYFLHHVDQYLNILVSISIKDDDVVLFNHLARAILDVGMYFVHTFTSLLSFGIYFLDFINDISIIVKPRAMQSRVLRSFSHLHSYHHLK